MTSEVPGGAIVLASRGQRLAGHIFEVALFGLTLGVGWLFWFANVGRGGQTPAKRLLGMRVIDGEGRPASLRRMVVRDVGLKVLAFVVLDLLLLSMEVDGGRRPRVRGYGRLVRGGAVVCVGREPPVPLGQGRGNARRGGVAWSGGRVRWSGCSIGAWRSTRRRWTRSR